MKLVKIDEMPSSHILIYLFTASFEMVEKKLWLIRNVLISVAVAYVVYTFFYTKPSYVLTVFGLKA